MPSVIPSTARNLLFLFFLFTLPAFAQGPATGTPPFGSFGGGPDVINLANLNADRVIPIFSRTGRGTDFHYTLTYDTSIWYPVTGSTTTWQPVGNYGWLGQTEAALGSFSFTQTSGGSCGFRCYIYVDSNFTYRDSFGVVHPFAGTETFYRQIGDVGGCTIGEPPTGGSLTAQANDGSGFVITVNPPLDCNHPLNAYVTSAAGKVTSAPQNLGSGPGTLTDANGNQLTADANRNFFDTLSSATPVLSLTGSGTSTDALKFTYTAPSGAATYTVNYKNYTLASNFGVSNIGEFKSVSAVPLVDTVVLPDNSQYSFAYEATPSIPVAGACTPWSGTTCVTGRVTSIALPTGGTITFAYSGGNNGIFSDGSTATLAYGTPDGMWTYAQVKGMGAASTTTVTDPQGNDTVISFQGIYETQRLTYQGSHSSGTLLQTINTCYNGAASPCTGTSFSLPITQRVVMPQFGATGRKCKHVYNYNSYGLLTEQDDYDYSTGTPTTILRKLLITYASLTNGIVGMPSTVKVQDGGGITKSQTTYCYDESTPSGTTVCAATGAPTATSGTPQHLSVTGSRGNTTTVAYSTSSSATIGKKITYYDTGMLKTSTDVNGALTTFNYADATSSCGNAFPTSISEPLSLSRSTTWNCTGAVTTQLTDENGRNTTISYTDSYFWRPASATDPTSAITNYTYTNPTTAETSLSINANSAVDILATLDGLGRSRLSQAKQSPGSTNFDTVQQDYDILGRPSRSTLPFSATAGTTNASAPSVSTTYDALGRPLTVTDAGGGTVTYQTTILLA